MEHILLPAAISLCAALQISCTDRLPIFHAAAASHDPASYYDSMQTCRADADGPCFKEPGLQCITVSIDRTGSDGIEMRTFLCRIPRSFSTNIDAGRPAQRTSRT